MSINKSLLVSIIIVLLIQIPLIAPFFHSGFFPSHDDFQVVRMYEIYQEIKDGNFPPRWSSGLLYGHGYPIFNFYGPFSYFLGAIFIGLGFNYLISTKLVFIFYFLISGVGMLLLLRSWVGPLAALVGTIIFSFAPYRALDVYVRGTLGEFAAFSIFPLVFWANIRLLNSFSRLWIGIFGLLIAVLIASHSLSSLLYIGFLFFFNIFYLLYLKLKDRKQLIIKLIQSLFLGIAAASFYWFPVIYEYPLIKLGEINFPYADYFVKFSDLWNSSWGFGGFIEKDQMSLRLGQVLILGSILTFGLNILIKTKYRSLIFFLASVFAISIFLEMEPSKILWDQFSFLNLLQFPWRLHILITILGSILSAFLFYLLSQAKLKSKKIVIYILAAICIFFSVKENYNFFKPKFYSNTPPISETTTWNDEYMPKWVISKPLDHAPDKIKITKGEGEVSQIEWGYIKKRFVVDTKQESQIQIAQVYFPGWQAYNNGQKINITYKNNQGLMEIQLPAGRNKIELKFVHILQRLIPEIVSLIAIFVAGYLIFKDIFSLKTKKTK